MLPGCQLPSTYRIVDTSEITPSAASALVLNQEAIHGEPQNAGTRHSTQTVSPVIHQTGATQQSQPISGSAAPLPKACVQSEISRKYHQALCGPPPAFNFRSDSHNMWNTLLDDTKGLVTWKNAAILGIATGSAISMHQSWDGKVRDYTAKNPDRWGETGKSIGYLGDFSVQIPLLVGLYSFSLWDQNEPLHDLSGTLISAYTITTATTSLLKVAVNSDRPTKDYNNGHYGFPSYHTSSSFAMASVLDEYYGHKVGLPAYALAGIIGWTRIDNRDHDLSDVMFGAALGTVIGKSVARQHLSSGNVEVLPYYDPVNDAAGVTVGVDY